MAPTKKSNSTKKSVNKKDNPCWNRYKKVGTKTKGGKKVNDCVPV
jgi:hypothetical protein